ncbi:MAG: membrane associated rhomboid family serine protease [Candidatus Krumholzibacteriia bacterium]|jgi:membrane associated rhomboid family serine protease
MRNFGSGAGGRSFGGRALTPGVKMLLIANIAVFVLQTLVEGGRGGQAVEFTNFFAFIPERAIFGFEIWRFGTYMFFHDGFFHIGFNMLILWMFGAPIEARWGKRSFLTYYAICGIGGAVTYGIFNLVGMSSFVPMIGASGAIYGLLLAYGMLFPEAVIFVFMIIPMKAKYAVMLFGLMELISSAGANNGIANLAHLGGMITGFVFLKLTIPALGSGLPGGLGGAFTRWNTKRKMKVVRPKKPRPNGSAETPKPGPGKQKQPEIDAILDKISREGLQSLTDEEQELLRRAGRK